MSKRLVYVGRYKGPLLMEELLTVHPEWLVGEGVSRQCLLRVETTDAEVRITVPDDADEAALAVLVEAHNPDALSLVERAETAAAEIDVQATVARSLWDGYEALVDKTPAEIVTLMQAAMDGWATLADARRDLREWLPRMAAFIAWGVRK